MDQIMADRILEKPDESEELVTIERWGETFLVCSLPGKIGMGLVALIGGKRINECGNYAAEYLVHSLRDPETRELIFTPEHAEALGGKNTGAIMELYTTMLRVSGLLDKDGAAKNVSAGAPGSEESTT